MPLLSVPGPDRGHSCPFVSPSRTSSQLATTTSSLPSLLAQSQRGFHALHSICNCVRGSVVSLRLGNGSVPAVPTRSLHTYSFLLSPLVPSAHLPPHLHKKLLSAALFDTPAVNCSTPPPRKLLKLGTWAHQAWLSHPLPAPFPSGKVPRTPTCLPAPRCSPSHHGPQLQEKRVCSKVPTSGFCELEPSHQPGDAVRRREEQVGSFSRCGLSTLMPMP